MKFSVTEQGNNQGFQTVETNDFSKLATHITYYNYSMATFKDGIRKNDNFEQVEAIALDFDGGLTIKEARLRFAMYQHIIAPTRSHQIEKNGEICDRFRVIIPLTRPIYNAEDYRETIRFLLQNNPEADKACSDPARMFYPSTSIDTFEPLGVRIEPKKGVLKEKKEVVPIRDIKGRLMQNTVEFLLFGVKSGERHHRLYQAAKDMQGQGYAPDEVIDAVNEMISRTGEWDQDELNEKSTQTVLDAFKDGNRDEVREVERPTFNFRTIGDLYKQDLKVEWLVNELLIEGGISILAASPKSGKSTLVRQLAKAVCNGEDFLGRKTVKGKVAYLALEEHPALLQKQFKNIGVNASDDILLHVGPIYGTDPTGDLIKFLKDYNAKVVVIDTLALFVGLDDINSYDKVNKAMAKVRLIARETGAHVMLIHHTNKNPETSLSSIMGSQAFLGAVDTAIIINCVGKKRYLKTTGRGLTNFVNCEIIFDKVTESYSLGLELDNEF